MGLFDRNKSVKPRKKHKKDTKRYTLHKHAEASLGTGYTLASAVKCPSNEDVNEWMAVHVVDFYNALTMLYGGVADDCRTSCASTTMSAGPKFEFHWQDGKKYKKPTPLPAPEYIDLCFNFVEASIDTLPSNGSFPKNFRATVKSVFKKMLRIYAHILFEHFRSISAAGAEAHINTSFKHFLYFVFEFDLLDRKDLSPTKEWIENHLESEYHSKVA